VGRPINSQTAIQALPKPSADLGLAEAKAAAKVKQVASEETQLAYTVDQKGHKLLVKISNHATGEVVRTLEFKNFNADAHELKKLAGHLIDQKT